MSLNDLLNKKEKAVLKGVKTAKLLKWKVVENDKGGYIETSWQLPDRNYTYNIFPGTGENEGKQISYVTSALRRQLELDDEEVSLGEILNTILETRREINMYFNYNQEYRTMNVAFHDARPIVITTPEEKVEAV